VPPARDEGRAALIAGLGCYTIWGLFPIYMYALGAAGVQPLEITAQRTAWALLWAAGLVLLARKGPELRQVLREPRTLGLLLASSLLIGINWLLYVIAVTSGSATSVSTRAFPRHCPRASAQPSAIPGGRITAVANAATPSVKRVICQVSDDMPRDPSRSERREESVFREDRRRFRRSQINDEVSGRLRLLGLL